MKELDGFPNFVYAADFEDGDGRLHLALGDNDGAADLTRSEVIALRDALTEWIGDDSGEVLAAFDEWCQRKGVRMHPGQAAAARSLLDTAARNTDVARFLMAMGAGRSFMIDQVNAFMHETAMSGNPPRPFGVDPDSHWAIPKR